MPSQSYVPREALSLHLQAQQKMKELAGSQLETLSEITATPTSQLKFVTDAWSQVPPAASTCVAVALPAGHEPSDLDWRFT